MVIANEDGRSATQSGSSPSGRASDAVSPVPASIPSAHEPHCPHPTQDRCNCRVADLAIALGVALKESCVHMGECYAVADDGVSYDGDVVAEVDGEISLMALAEAAILHITTQSERTGA